VAEACAAVGHPMGSKWCWTSSDARIAAGEVGTVVGYSHEHGQVRVKFSKGTWPLAQLITLEAWQEREAVLSYALPHVVFCRAPRQLYLPFFF
jgi:hypothetical protein